MAAITFQLPDGTKVRSASQRRFVLIRQHDVTGEGRIVQRSDQAWVLRDSRKRRSGDFLADSVSGAVSRL